jgi:hypothetical protein
MATEAGTRSNFIYCLVGCLSFVAGAVVATGLASVVVNLVVPVDPLSVVGSILILVWPIMAGVAVARLACWRYRKRTGNAAPSFLSNKPLITMVFAGYLLTWVVGVPAVQNSITERAIRLSIHADRIESLNPGEPQFRYSYAETYAAFPIVPFVVVIHHDYSADPLKGWGGVEFYLWFGAGTERLFRQRFGLI